MSLSDPAFDRVRDELRRSVSETNWRLWLEKVRLRERTDDVLVLEAPDNVRRWIQDRFGRRLQTCTRAVLGPDVQVELVAPGAGTVAPTGAPAPVRVPMAGANPGWAFEHFVIGPGNRMAHAAALAVAETPGVTYSPLFVYGPPGLGKTHLLHAVARHVERFGGGLTVRYTTAEAFTNHFTGAVRSEGMAAFKATYRDVDVLLVDDVQFLAAKARTMEEFLHTFDAVQAMGAQIVLSSDRPPHDLEATDERLRARYQSGLVVGLDPPDLPTRRAILRKRAAQTTEQGVDDDALELIARRVDDNVRTLEGALIRVVAFASLTGRPATAALAEELLSGLYPQLAPGPPAGPPSVQRILEAVSAAFGVTPEALVSPSRAVGVAWPRQVAMHLARELTSASLPAIGAAFARRHTTVMHACRKVAERTQGDPEAAALVHRLSVELSG